MLRIVDLSLDIPQQFCSRGVKTKDGEQLRCTLSGEHMFNTILLRQHGAFHSIGHSLHVHLCIPMCASYLK